MSHRYRCHECTARAPYYIEAPERNRTTIMLYLCLAHLRAFVVNGLDAVGRGKE